MKCRVKRITNAAAECGGETRDPLTLDDFTPTAENTDGIIGVACAAAGATEQENPPTTCYYHYDSNETGINHVLAQKSGAKWPHNRVPVTRENYIELLQLFGYEPPMSQKAAAERRRLGESLVRTAEYGNFERIRHLMRNDVLRYGLDKRDAELAFQRAAMNNDTLVLRQLMDGYHYTESFLADMLPLLMENDIRSVLRIVRDTPSLAQTAIDIAAQTGDLMALQVLLKETPAPQDQQQQRQAFAQSALRKAVAGNQLQIVLFLLSSLPQSEELPQYVQQWAREHHYDFILRHE